MKSVDLEREFPKLQPHVLEIALELQNLILRIFPAAEVTFDGENVGFGLGSGYKGLVFVISPFRTHVNLGVVSGAILEALVGLLQGTGKVHRHVKLKQIEQVQDPELEELMLRALQAAQKRILKKGLTTRGNRTLRLRSQVCIHSSRMAVLYRRVEVK
jgi:hypothetical protein